jgi:hypothetical protein
MDPFHEISCIAFVSSLLLSSFFFLSSFSGIIWVWSVYIQEVAEIAEWEDEQIEYIKEKVTEEGKQEDLKKGKAPAQVL